MNPDIILSHLGFSDKEIKVYMSCLELGTAPMSHIAKRARLKRANTYVIMNKLKEKGFAECFLKKHVRHFGVVSPTVLYERYQQHLNELHKAIPQMMARYNRLSNKPTITYYEGREDIKRLYIDVLNTKSKEVLNYFLPDKPFEYFGEEWVRTEHINKRVEKGIRLKVIMPQSQWTEDYQKRSEKELRDLRLMKQEEMYFTNETFIYDDKMSIFSFDEDFAILIESQDVVRTQRIMFELAWNSSLVA